MNMKAETYKTIEKYPRYKISSYGRVIDTLSGKQRSITAIHKPINGISIAGCQIWASYQLPHTTIQPIRIYVEYFPEYINIKEINDNKHKKSSYYPDQISSDYFNDEEFNVLLHNLFVFKDEKEKLMKSWRQIPVYTNYIMDKTGEVYSKRYIHKHKPGIVADAYGKMQLIVNGYKREPMLELYNATFPEHKASMSKAEVNGEFVYIDETFKCEGLNSNEAEKLKQNLFDTKKLAVILVEGVDHSKKPEKKTNKPVKEDMSETNRQNNLALAKELEAKYSKICIYKLDSRDKCSYMTFDELKNICKNEEMYYDCIWTIYKFPYRKELDETWELV